MDVFYKGYVVTNGKQSTEQLKDRTDFKTLDEVKDSESYAGVLAENAVVIDIDDMETANLLMNALEDMEARCRVYQTTRGMHFVFYNRTMKIDKCGTNVKLACGLNGDIKTGMKCSYEVIKCHGKERKIIYDILDGEDYEEAPPFLRAVRTNVDFLHMGEGDGRNQTLFNYILTLQSAGFNTDEVKTTLQFINKYILKKPLDLKELDTIMRDEAFDSPVFFHGNNFLFDVFAQYMKAQHHIIRINGALHCYEDGVYKAGFENIERHMLEHIPQLNKAKRQEVLAYLDVIIRENTPASEPTLIAFKNGVYDLTEGVLKPFSDDYVITNVIPWNYNPNAYDELTDSILDSIACHDSATRSLMAELVGYCLFARNELGKAFILTGTGSNGKSTFLNMIKNLLGHDNISVLDLKKLGDRFSTIMLYGKLANIGDDISDEFLADTSEFKKVVTGEMIDAEQKGQPKINFAPYCKLLFSANYIPRIGRGRDSSAVLRRLVIVPFNAKFTPNSPDYRPFIGDDLKTPSAMEYLINIAIEGLKNVLDRRTFTTSKAMEEELRDYEEQTNPIITFFRDVEDGIIKVEGETVDTVYTSYKEFCITSECMAMSKIEFLKQLKRNYGYARIDTKVDGKKLSILSKSC